VLAALACYLGAFLTWLLILRGQELSRAFPLSAVGYVTVLLASAWMLGETVDLGRWAGAGLIVAGVTVLGGE
jgi:drug/metabolite transporter (DMT)-like permease